ncbi:MAG: ABC transporter ATP-binding protein [Bacillota bacterium]|jgi:putative ABC transport system ATP-binding protein|nr:ABC transporter ATP-binding protein [Bacillota bacterium]
MAILKLNDVSYSYQNQYQSVEAVKNVSLELEQGKVYAIIGKSGSGKSTLLSLMAGLTLPKSGEILYDGESIKNLDMEEYRRDKASVIYQTFNLFPLMTVLENVIFPLELKGMKHLEAKAIAERHIASVGLDKNHHKRFPNMLSGGERQRVAIARALATGSRLLLADEPTGNLDMANGDLVVKLLIDLAHKDKLAVVIVTHDLSIADKADEVFQMNDGILSRM